MTILEINKLNEFVGVWLKVCLRVTKILLVHGNMAYVTLIAYLHTVYLWKLWLLSNFVGNADPQNPLTFLTTNKDGFRACISEVLQMKLFTFKLFKN